MGATPRKRLAVAAILTSLALSACGSGAAGRETDAAGKPIHGGTAYFAEQPGSPPDYIFPLVSGEYYSPANVNDLQTLLYRPLYWYGDHDRPGIDYGLSLGNAPVYSAHDSVVTITLKRARWSDGEALSARDVGFWIDLLKADRDDWASYVPGGFPDNVASWKALGQRTIQLRLTGSYNPVWFTNNELSQITPLPLAWDRTSLSQAAPSDDAGDLPDATTAGAKAVYAFLNRQSKDVSGYATSPIWSVVDGPWKLIGLNAQGEATFVPNPSYNGPNRPHLARFVELPFTSETSEFLVLKTGSATGGPGTPGPQISVGWIPDTDVPQAPAMRRQGYRLIEFYPFGFDYFEPNLNNPTVGPILRQLYFRQAFQHLVDQPGWIRAYYDGLGVPNYSPVPAQPSNPYSDPEASANPYPFSVAAARAILVAHGWKVVAGGVSTCLRPGSAGDECGSGIRSGQPLQFTLMYPLDYSYTVGAMADLQAVARRVGISLTLKGVPSTTIDAVIEPCTPKQAACSWELGQYGAAWIFSPDHDPTGEETFETGALGNVGSYSNPAVDRLIKASTTVPAGRAQAALNAYANLVRRDVPVFWQPAPGTMLTVQSNLRGVVPNAYGYISPEEWYFTG